MKNIILCMVGLYASVLFAQKPLDTIFTNGQKTVALFFPKSIRQAIVGNDHFVFTYNKNQGQRMGLLQASPGKVSNLLVITRDGTVYSYLIGYSKSLTKLTYFIGASEGIGNVQSSLAKMEKKRKRVRVVPTKVFDVHDMYKKIGVELLASTTNRSLRSKKRQGIRLSVKKMVYHREAMYMVLEIRNSSVIDYDVNFLRFGIESKSGLKRKSAQMVWKMPVFRYLQPHRIKGNATRTFVVVFDKFTMDRTKKMVIVLNELGGERNLRLKVGNWVFDGID